MLLKRGQQFELEGTPYIEFHMDNVWDLLFMKPLTKQTGQVKKFRGHQYIFREDKKRKPLILLCQDEAICKQYLTNNMCWHGKNGDFCLVPKDEGMGFTAAAVLERRLSSLDDLRRHP